jgi:hypothetical protein
MITKLIKSVRYDIYGQYQDRLAGICVKTVDGQVLGSVEAEFTDAAAPAVASNWLEFLRLQGTRGCIAPFFTDIEPSEALSEKPTGVRERNNCVKRTDASPRFPLR